jgi:hypothetical protein
MMRGAAPTKEAELELGAMKVARGLATSQHRPAASEEQAERGKYTYNKCSQRF